ncbi:hypothetical protein [Marisediminicola senii]|uniref:hypothetical protein n=1 Tax=Marisediminicola senii TaxID=2711233 RepID=UPI0013E9D835|nr:hypothetical protein [Marisediminicola senii]
MKPVIGAPVERTTQAYSRKPRVEVSALWRPVAIGLLVGAMVASGGVANAAEDPTEALAGIVETAVASLPTPAGNEVGPGVDVAVPTSPDGKIVVSTSSATDFAVQLPNEVNATSGVIADNGSTIYSGIGASADVSVEPLKDGVRISTIIPDAGSGSVFTYPLAPGVTAEANADGSVSLFEDVAVVDPDTGKTMNAQIEVALVQAPWAVDASGAAVGTRYEIVDNSIVQVIDHVGSKVDYPIVADPTFTPINPFQTRIRWNRAETATIASGGWGATGLTAVCGLAGAAAGGPIGAAAFAALCLAASGSAVYTAGVAQNSNPKRCLQLTITSTIITAPIPYFDTYACR